MVNPGDRVAQLVVKKVQLPDWDIVSEFTTGELVSERESGGFGSTGC